MAEKDDGIAVGEMGHDRAEMEEEFRPIRDVLGGTHRMQEVAIRERRWLPQFAKENDGAYEARVQSSFLHNFYGDTVARLIAKPFSQPIDAHEDDLPEQLRPIVSDVDMNGTPLQQFAQDSFSDGVNYGMAMSVVDYTEIPKNAEARAQSQRADWANDMRAAARARFIRVSPLAYLGSALRRGPAGNIILTQFRYKDRRIERLGNFGEEMMDYVIVVGENYIQEWRKKESEEVYVAQPAKPHTFGSVPVEVFYTNRKGFLRACPPLLDLAWVTIDHWQSYSDQRNILHIARVPVLFRTGVDQEEEPGKDKEGGFVLGASRVVSTSKPPSIATMAYVEPSGTAIASGENHLNMLQHRAELMGAEPTTAKGPTTATGELRAESKATCSLLSWIEACEWYLYNLFVAAAKWTPSRVKIPDDWKVAIYKDFDLTARGTMEYQLIQADAAAGRITASRCTSEGKRRGIYPDDFDPEEEADIALSSLPPIGNSEEPAPPAPAGTVAAA